MRNRLAMIGVGNMGAAITEGIIGSGMMECRNIYLYDRDIEKLSSFDERGCMIAESAVDAVKECDAVLLAVKPQIIGAVMEELSPYASGKLFITIAAGVKIERISAALPGAVVARVMPNTPLMVGCGVSAICFGEGADEDDKSFAKRIFASAGTVFETAEENMNSATALTSSAVAYFARIIGAMSRWAKENGFGEMDEAELWRLVCKTAEGTAKVIEERNMAPAALVKAVTSPKGTTEKALEAFDEYKLEEAFGAAMNACVKRAEELSGM